MSLGSIILFFYCLLSALVYLGLMLYFRQGLKKNSTPLIQSKNSITFISVVVCFRNEESNLPELLESLVSQHYPVNNYEIILYNDASNDGSMAIIKKFQAQYTAPLIICRDVPLKQGANSPKKLALNDAASKSNAELIVVTDADCTLNANWLVLIEQSYLQENALMITGPVATKKGRGWLNELQYIELQALAAVSAGAIGHKNAIMCNGANLGFNRKAFLSLDPYKYNLHISSGDDMFLLLQMQHYHKNRIVYLAHAESVVYTKGKEHLRDYLNQRVRWASKSKSYQQYVIKGVALLVLNFNAIPLFIPLLALKIKWIYVLVLFVSLILIKQTADILLLSRFSKQVDMKVNYWKLLLFQYIEALLTLLVAIKSIKGSYVWKGRKQHF
jgi:cellulose synthase/poly-beta-1,6-N-acetylglucosamine synthase-like glycosyltransferase